MRESSAKKDTPLLAHQSSRFDMCGRVPHHDEIGFRHVLKALIQVELFLLETAGITQEAAATSLGIVDRVMRYYLSSQESATYRPAPYAIQDALEQLAAYATKKRRVKRA